MSLTLALLRLITRRVPHSLHRHTHTHTHRINIYMCVCYLPTFSPFGPQIINENCTNLHYIFAIMDLLDKATIQCREFCKCINVVGTTYAKVLPISIGLSCNYIHFVLNLCLFKDITVKMPSVQYI